MGDIQERNRPSVENPASTISRNLRTVFARKLCVVLCERTESNMREYGGPSKNKNLGPCEIQGGP